MDILLEFVKSLLMFILGVIANHFYRKWRIESPNIKILFRYASWSWEREPDYSAGGEDWNVLKLKTSFIIRNFGATVSIVEEEIEIFNGKTRKKNENKLVDPSHQVELNYEWELCNDYSGLDKSQLNSLPTNITPGKLMISDSLGNSYSCVFQVPKAPTEAEYRTSR